MTALILGCLREFPTILILDPTNISQFGFLKIFFKISFHVLILGWNQAKVLYSISSGTDFELFTFKSRNLFFSDFSISVIRDFPTIRSGQVFFPDCPSSPRWTVVPKMIFGDRQGKMKVTGMTARSMLLIVPDIMPIQNHVLGTHL